jgi:hypothetical protein
MYTSVMHEIDACQTGDVVLRRRESRRMIWFSRAMSDGVTPMSHVMSFNVTRPSKAISYLSSSSLSFFLLLSHLVPAPLVILEFSSIIGARVCHLHRHIFLYFEIFAWINSCSTDSRLNQCICD